MPAALSASLRGPKISASLPRWELDAEEEDAAAAEEDAEEEDAAKPADLFSRLLFWPESPDE